MKKIALTGGGTAGHITPNLALLPELKKRNFDIIYIGSKDGMDESIIKRYDIPFFGITSDKLRRYFDTKNFAMPFNVLKGIQEAKKILKKEKVDIIFSKGGFVAVPVVFAAHSIHIPVISHEADLSLGLANKLCLPFSKKVCTNFEETAHSIKGDKGVYTGCPIRESLFKGNNKLGKEFLDFKNDKPILFVIGGSLGSVYINNLIRSNLDKLLQTFNIVHGCGEGKINDTIKKDGYIQFELITTHLPDIYACSDIVISRAGANVIFELRALKKVSLLIPLSKNASRGDQILNANLFKKKGLSDVLLEEDQEKNPSLFYEKVMDLYHNKEKYSTNLINASLPDATITICDIIEENL